MVAVGGDAWRRAPARRRSACRAVERRGLVGQPLRPRRRARAAPAPRAGHAVGVGGRRSGAGRVERAAGRRRGRAAAPCLRAGRRPGRLGAEAGVVGARRSRALGHHRRHRLDPGVAAVQHAAEERVEHRQEASSGGEPWPSWNRNSFLNGSPVERLEEVDALLLLDVEVLPAVRDQRRDVEARRRPCGSRARARRRRSRARCRSPSACAARRRRAGSGRARRRSPTGRSAACGRSRSRTRAACRSPRRSGAASCPSSGRRASRRSRTSARSRRSGRSPASPGASLERAATMFAVVPS